MFHYKAFKVHIPLMLTRNGDIKPLFAVWLSCRDARPILVPPKHKHANLLPSSLYLARRYSSMEEKGK